MLIDTRKRSVLVYAKFKSAVVTNTVLTVEQNFKKTVFMEVLVRGKS